MELEGEEFLVLAEEGGQKVLEVAVLQELEGEVQTEILLEKLLQVDLLAIH